MGKRRRSRFLPLTSSSHHARRSTYYQTHVRPIWTTTESNRRVEFSSVTSHLPMPPLSLPLPPDLLPSSAEASTPIRRSGSSNKSWEEVPAGKLEGEQREVDVDMSMVEVRSEDSSVLLESSGVTSEEEDLDLPPLHSASFIPPFPEISLNLPLAQLRSAYLLIAQSVTTSFDHSSEAIF